MTETMSLLPAAVRIAERRGTKIPAGLKLAMRSVQANFESTRGFQWPFPGHWATADGPFTTNDDPCPSAPGDGLCAAKTWRGMASGRIPATTILLVGYRQPDVLAESTDKLRAKRIRVLEVLTPRELLAERTDEESANLCGANLSGANLSGADLSGADLYGAYLRGANLRGADLYGADLSGADLSGADLYGANLSRANLSRANLSGASLYGADLSGANLSRADLSRANLYGANLSRALNVPSEAI